MSSVCQGPLNWSETTAFQSFHWLHLDAGTAPHPLLLAVLTGLYNPEVVPSALDYQRPMTAAFERGHG